MRSDLEAAKPSHDEQVSRIRKWTDLLHGTGSSKATKVKGRSAIQPKLIRRQAEWRYSALTEPFLSSSKLFSVTPVTFEDTPASRQNELLLNWQFRTKLNRVKFIDDFVRAVVDEGTAVLQTGWVRVTKMVKETAPEFSFYPLQSEEEMQQLQQAIELSQANPNEFQNLSKELQEAVSYYEETGEPTVAVQTGEVDIEVEKVIENRPTVKIHNPSNVHIDPSCEGELDDALFVVVTFETNKAELQKQGDRFKNLDKVNWEATTKTNQGEHETKTGSDFAFKDAARKKVIAYEYWGFYDIDGSGELVPIVATWIGDTMIRMEENPFPDQKLPFILVPYLPLKREMYGEPDAELLEDNQKIVGATMRGIVDLLGRSANGQQGFAKGMLDPLNKRRYENGQDYEFNPNMTPDAGIVNHKFSEVPQSAMLMLNLQNNEAEALTGVKSFAGGMSGNVYGDVAAGIRGMLDAASKREMAILRRLARGIAMVGRKFTSMNSIYLSEEEVVRVTNDEFVTIRREDLEGEFDLIVDIATAEVDNAKSQDLGFMLQTIGPQMDTAITMKILAEIAELKRMPDLAQDLRTYQPQPDPVQEQLKQLELEKAQKEIEKLQSEIELNNANAKRAASISDKLDLDYVEQESGTQHEREMAKQKAQSQGNQNLQVTKALTKAMKPDERNPDIAAAVGFNQLSDKMDQVQPRQSLYNADEFAQAPTRPDPVSNLGSKYFDPTIDPALNPSINL